MFNVQTLHRRAARVLPEVVQTSGLLADTMERSQLAAMLFPLRHQSSGAIRFRLSMATVEAMRRQPMAYLQQSTCARAALGRQQKPFLYRCWRRARLPGQWLGMLEPSGSTQPLVAVDAYFTTKMDGKALLVVVPDAGIAVYFWRD